MRAAQRAMGGAPIAPEGLAARVIVAFLGTAGIFYVNVMPALIDALKVSAGFTNLQAGIIGAANTYGGALGSVTVALLVRRVRWYPVANLLLPALIAMDLLSMQLHGAEWLRLGVVGFHVEDRARVRAPDWGARAGRRPVCGSHRRFAALRQLLIDGRHRAGNAS